MADRHNIINMPQDDRDFFLLLRAGLWQRVEEALSASLDWPYIYRLACEQTVQGIVADGFGLYKAAYDRGDFGNAASPFKRCSESVEARDEWASVYNEFINQSAQIVRQNYNINQVQAKVCQTLTDNDINYVVIKGQGVAKCYTKPMLRCPGDIDILLPLESYERAKALFDPDGEHQASENHADLHYGIDVDGIEVELHGMANTESGGCLDRVLDRERDLLFQTNGFDTITIAGVPCLLPNATYHAMYLFFHCLRHYMGTGLGLRQICDMAIFLHIHRQQIDWSHLHGVVHETRVESEWQQFFSFCIHYLGMPHDVLETWNDNTATQLKPSEDSVLSLWLHAKVNGNFGHNHESLLAGHPNRLIHISNLLRYNLITFTRVVRVNPRVAFSRLFRQVGFR